MARSAVLVPKDEVAQDHHEEAQGKDHRRAIRMMSPHPMKNGDDGDDHGDRQKCDIGEQAAHETEPCEGKQSKGHARQQTVDGTDGAGIGSQAIKVQALEHARIIYPRGVAYPCLIGTTNHVDTVWELRFSNLKSMPRAVANRGLGVTRALEGPYPPCPCQ